MVPQSTRALIFWAAGLKRSAAGIIRRRFMASKILLLLFVLGYSAFGAEPPKLKVKILEATPADVSDLLRIHIPDSELLADEIESLAGEAAGSEFSSWLGVLSPGQTSMLLERLGEKAKEVNAPNEKAPLPIDAKTSFDGRIIEFALDKENEALGTMTTHADHSVLVLVPGVNGESANHLYLIYPES